MAELTNHLCKTVKSLNERKTRKKESAFKAEGTKCVLDTLGHFNLRYLIATTGWIDDHASVISRIAPELIVKCPKREMERLSSLTTPSEVIAVYDIPQYHFDSNSVTDNIVLALDTIQDPGNLGTIIRVADWFGVTNIICTYETADCFSPKVVQATMGSISRIKVHYCDLAETLSELPSTNIYGTFLDGDNISEIAIENKGVIVIGNEGKGISDEIENLVTHRLLIPSYPKDRQTGESLNAAIATAITLAKFRGI
ncbi:MAG: RNA methyltransferase [Muribaculaceae bacterium]|nr:RNA methyltransferase [Muribaculaceae bacterium]